MQNRHCTRASVTAFGLTLLLSSNAYAMALRSFVALPVEKGGAVMRISIERTADSKTDTLSTGVAYGLGSKQTVLIDLPYRLSPAGEKRQGDLSLLYRHILWQQDHFNGTDRLALLGGAVFPTETERDTALQAGVVFTHFKQRHEIDLDALYQIGTGERLDRGRYDLSWQYRLTPSERPEWGFSNEINTVVELNGRWQQEQNTTHQLTLGLQWIQQSWVLEGGISQDLNNNQEQRTLISTRFHF
ncbi:MAG: hypothetical protein Q9N68_12185 [Gammaproteobacteria bacterium]|nr:hypothetical protein [Gammaproteobacteria bacterium]